MINQAIFDEIERCEREAEIAKKNGNFELALLKLDAARRLREKVGTNARSVGQ